MNLAESQGGDIFTTASHKLRAVKYSATGNFASLLEHLRISLLVSTYEAGQMISIGSLKGSLTFSFQPFDQVMRIAVGGDRLAIGARRQIHFLKSAPEVASRLQPHEDHAAFIRGCRVELCFLDVKVFKLGVFQ